MSRYAGERLEPYELRKLQRNRRRASATPIATNRSANRTAQVTPYMKFLPKYYTTQKAKSQHKTLLFIKSHLPHNEQKPRIKDSAYIFQIRAFTVGFTDVCEARENARARPAIPRQARKTRCETVAYICHYSAFLCIRTSPFCFVQNTICSQNSVKIAAKPTGKSPHFRTFTISQK